MQQEKLYIPSLDREVSTLMQIADDGAPWVVLAHGAGADMNHQHMQSLADMLGGLGLNTLRFNFPYKEDGGHRTDKLEVCLATIDAVLASPCLTSAPYLAGHSFGGRMMTHWAAEHGDADIAGLILFSFPLHGAKKPDTRRAAHLPDITYPMLFLSGERDNMADPALMNTLAERLPQAHLTWLETADHSYKPLKRSRQRTDTVYEEAAESLQQWLSGQPRH